MPDLPGLPPEDAATLVATAAVELVFELPAALVHATALTLVTSVVLLRETGAADEGFAEVVGAEEDDTDNA